jgi:RHS repeat-associated protein
MVALAEKFSRETFTPQNRTARNSYRPQNTYRDFFLQPKNRGPAQNNRVLSSKYLDDSLEWYYYGFRYYSPELGRWVSRDPIGERGGRNLYCFVKNSPVFSIDLLGMHGDCECITVDVTCGPWINDGPAYERSRTFENEVTYANVRLLYGTMLGYDKRVRCVWARDRIERRQTIIWYNQPQRTECMLTRICSNCDEYCRTEWYFYYRYRTQPQVDVTGATRSYYEETWRDFTWQGSMTFDQAEIRARCRVQGRPDGW